MKKIILTFAIGLFLFSCQHDEMDSLNNSESLTVKKNVSNVLSFESKEEYLNLLKDNSLFNQKTTNFVSLLDKYEFEKENEKKN
jgi:hypothetical protein